MKNNSSKAFIFFVMMMGIYSITNASFLSIDFSADTTKELQDDKTKIETRFGSQVELQKLKLTLTKYCFYFNIYPKLIADKNFLQNFCADLGGNVSTCNYPSEKKEYLNIAGHKVLALNVTYNKDSSQVIFSIQNKETGFDIYKCEKKENGTWSTPKRFDSKINSIYDECYPFLADDDVTLFFSSNNPNSVGGFDIFSTTLNDEGQWSVPETMGADINSKKDDMKFVLIPKTDLAFYCSAEPQKGEKIDFYYVKLK